MTYAKTSVRAGQRALREEMRALGMSRQQIAGELARRWQLRPRAAWRHAHGWSLTEAAEQINACASAAGLDGDGVTVAMAVAHPSLMRSRRMNGSPGEGTRVRMRPTTCTASCCRGCITRPMAPSSVTSAAWRLESRSPEVFAAPHVLLFWRSSQRQVAQDRHIPYCSDLGKCHPVSGAVWKALSVDELA